MVHCVFRYCEAVSSPSMSICCPVSFVYLMLWYCLCGGGGSSHW